MNLTIADKTFEPFITFDEIQSRIRVLASQLNNDYAEKTPLFVGVLNGSFMFMADLMKEISIPCDTAFIKLSSYNGNTHSSGEVKEEFGLGTEIKNRDVIIIEDVIDTGRTLNYLIKNFENQEPASVKIVSLLYKPDAVQIPFSKENVYICFEIANDFVVGYGLDYHGLGRNTKDIYKVKS